MFPSADEGDVQKHHRAPYHWKLVEHDLGMPHKRAVKCRGAHADDSDEDVDEHISGSIGQSAAGDHSVDANQNEGKVGYGVPKFRDERRPCVVVLWFWLLLVRSEHVKIAMAYFAPVHGRRVITPWACQRTVSDAFRTRSAPS